jgi:hypothetical protein
MPRISAKARRQALAARIARELFTGGTGSHATRLVLMVPVPDDTLLDGKQSEREIGGWCETSAADVIEAHLRPGQRRRAAR